MTMTEWAKKEVELFKEKQDDYGKLCADSALDAFLSLMADDHSGFSIKITQNLLNRLINGQPLQPIEDKDFFVNDKDYSFLSDSEEQLKKVGLKSSLQCPRMSSLFRNEKLDGTVIYDDVERTIFIDTYDENNPSTWHSGEADKIVNKLFPIKMPYYPSTKQYKIYGKSMYVDENGNDKTKEHPGTFNKTIYEYLITPKGERIELNIIKTD